MSALFESSEALNSAIAAFLGARGYGVEQPEDGLFVARADPQALAEGEARAVVAVIAPPSGDLVEVDGVLARIKAARDAGVEGEILIVARGGAGAQTNRPRFADANAKIVTPLGFFDDLYRGDRRLREALKPHTPPDRAPQPYRRLASLDPAESRAPVDGGDLYDELLPRLAAAPDKPSLTVICGAAGVGKTVLVAALISQLQTAFNAAKQSYAGAAARPLLFEPAELGSQDLGDVDRLIDQLQGAMVAERMASDAFHWLHDHGLSTWFFDGLDEFYRHQSDFFPMLSEKLRDPESRARIVIATRDSILASGDALIGFLTEHLEDETTEVSLYEVRRWDAASKRAFVEASLGDRPEPEKTREAERIMAALEGDENLRALTDLPFYCRVFVEALASGDAAGLGDEFALLQRAIDTLIDREAEKLNVDWTAFITPQDALAIRAAAEAEGGSKPDREARAQAMLAEMGRAGLEHLLGSAAHFYRFGQDDPKAMNQITVDEWREALTPLYINFELEEAVQQRYETALLQFPFFGRGDAEGSMGFIHELVADYLAAKFAAQLAEERPSASERWRLVVGARHPIDDTVFFRYLRQTLLDNDALRAAAQAALANPRLTAPQKETLTALAADP